MEILDNSGNARVFGWKEGDPDGLPQELTPVEMRKSFSSASPSSSSNEGSATRPPAPQDEEPAFGDEEELMEDARLDRGFEF